MLMRVIKVRVPESAETFTRRTTPSNDFPGNAGSVIVAFCPITNEMHVGLRHSDTDLYGIEVNDFEDRLPWLAVSPGSMDRFEIKPFTGERSSVSVRRFRDIFSEAMACSYCCLADSYADLYFS